MSVPVACAMFVAGLAVSLASSLVFGRKLDRVTERVGVSEGLHGLFTALGADAPEISSAVAALVAGRKDLGVGVVLGSNVFNLAGLLGLGALIAGGVRIHQHGLVLNGLPALGVAGVATALILGAIGSAVALVLVVAIVAPYVALLAVKPAQIRDLGHERPWARLLALAVAEEIEDARRDVPPGKASVDDLLTLVPSLAAIVGSSVAMVTGAAYLGDRWGVPDVVVGTLVLAALTSLPNVLTAVRLALHRRGSAVVSESLNSNTLNVIAGISIPALFIALGTAPGTVAFSAWWLLAMTALVLGVGYARGGFGRLAGVVVVTLYAVFAAVVAIR